MLIGLKNGSVSAAVETMGGELQSFKRRDGRELLWQGDPQYWANRATVLFPMVGALRNGRAMIGEHWYEMGQHGLARHREFAVKERGADFVTLRLTADEKTLLQYPFFFIFAVTYRLCEQGIVTEFAVENGGEEPMPYAVGGHPGFNVPMEEGEAFTDYSIRFEKPESLCCPKIDMAQKLIDFTREGLKLEEVREIPLRHSLFTEDALIFDGLRSKKVSLVSRAGRGVTMEFADFPMLGIWSPANDGPLVALEPWTGCATTTQEGDLFEKKRYMRLLAPGKKETHSFTVYYF